MSLDDLLDDPAVGPAETSLRVCLAGRLLPKVQMVVSELAAIEAQVARDPRVRAAEDALASALEGVDEEGDDARPHKAGQSPARLRRDYDNVYAQVRDTWPGWFEKRGELEALNTQVAKFTGDLVLRAGSEGDWLRFVSANPARITPVMTKGADGSETQSAERTNPEDALLTGGRCNADALRADLARYVHSFNGERVADEERRQKLLDGLAGGDRRDCVKAVVQLHEGKFDLPKVVSDLLDDLKSDAH